MAIKPHQRLEALGRIDSGASVRDVAAECGVTVRTVQSWLRWRRSGGLAVLARKNAVERKAYLLKERWPGCTVSRAKVMLAARGINISPRAVWEIWRRYGLAGYLKDGTTAGYQSYLARSPVFDKLLAQARQLLKAGRVKAAADVVNGMPSCPDAEILLDIPDDLLSLRRRVDKLYPLSGRVPLTQSFETAKALRRALLARGFVYSGLRIAALEQKNLLLMGRIKEGLFLTGRIEPLLPKQGDPALLFTFLYTKAQLLSRSGDCRRAGQCMAKCRTLARCLKSPLYASFVSSYYGETGDNRRAIAMVDRFMPKFKGAYRLKALQDQAIRLDISGRTPEALKMFPKPSTPGEPMAYHYTKILARHRLAQGRLKEAIECAHRTLQNPGCLRTMPALFPIVSDLYCLYAGLGRASDQRDRLKQITSVCLKEGNVSVASMGKALLESAQNLPDAGGCHPQVRMAELLKRSDNDHSLKFYRQACRLAGRFGLWGRLRMLCLAYPWPVRELLKLGRPTGLPGAMHKLPVFNDGAVSVKVEFLGRIRLFRDDKHLKARLAPKDASLLIHLALAPGHRLSAECVVSNYWPKAKKPLADISHALLRLRRALRAPTHVLSAKGGEVAADMHFTTDYGEWNRALKISKAFAGAGQAEMARAEMLGALRLFRGAPFHLMYDEWSDRRRNEIMLDFESRALEFAKAEMETSRRSSARWVLKKIIAVDPASDAACEMLKGMFKT